MKPKQLVGKAPLQPGPLNTLENDSSSTDGTPDWEESPDWLHSIDVAKHHSVSVEELPAPGQGNRIVRVVAGCTCGWRSGEHEIYLDASTSWAKDRARHQIENAG